MTEKSITEHVLTESRGKRTIRERLGTVQWGRNLLCGAVIGAGAVLPGVSGGVLAVAFGLYGPLMELLSRPRTALPRYWPLLPPLGIGWAAGFFLAAKGMAAAFGLSEAAATWFFIGLIAGTLPALWRQAGQAGQAVQNGQTKRTPRGRAAWVSLLFSAVTVYAALYYVTHVLRYTAEPSLFWYAVCGTLWGLSVVVPGLTSASVLIALGLYQPMLDALGRFDFGVFAACVPSMVLAAVLPARGVSWLMARYPSAALHGILGMVAASTAAIVPRTGGGAGETALGAVCCAAGFLLARAMERWDSRNADGREIADGVEKC